MKIMTPQFSRRARLLLLPLFLIAFLSVNAQSTGRILLKGNIVTPDGVLKGGWLDINHGVIVHLSTEKPEAVEASSIETDDLIFPGFIDLHNHPAFNIFPRWTPPHKFQNRYEWRRWEPYKKALENKGYALIGNPANFCEINEYAEIKALIGGTTSLIGFSNINAPDQPQPACIEGLVRNLDAATGFYGPGQGHERIANSIGITALDMNANSAARVAEQIRSGSLDLLAIHIAEGLPTDPESAQELDQLAAHDLLNSHVTLIHSVGLSPTQLARVHSAGASIVWSPRSNFELYGHTANVDAAFHQGVTIALAPDWSPSGSDNMWDEIRYAHTVSLNQLASLFSDRQLVEMASDIPARIARIDDKVGTLAAGMRADFFLVHTNLDPTNKDTLTNPYSIIANGNITQIDLVVINGIPVYGAPTLLNKLTDKTEPLTVCGTEKALNLAALPAGSFAAVEASLTVKLTKLNVTLAPIAECDGVK